MIIATDPDPRVITDVVFMYARNSVQKKWMDEVIIIFWGPAGKTIVSTLELKAAVMDLINIQNLKVWADQVCSDDYGITEKLQNLGIDVLHIGEKVSNMLHEGWKQLTF